MYITKKSTNSISRLMLVVLTILILIQNASAISLGVSPQSLQFSLEEGSVQKNITIINNGNEVTTYGIYPDSDYSDWTSIYPSEFDLAPGMTKEVTVQCIPSDYVAGNITFRLNIAAKPAGTGLGIGAGIRIPVTVIGGSGGELSDVPFLTSFSKYFLNYF